MTTPPARHPVNAAPRSPFAGNARCPGRAWPRRGRGRGCALRRVRQDDAEGVEETALGGTWRTDAGQHVAHAAPLSEVAELARGESTSGRAIELDWVFIDPTQRGSSSAAWAGLPRDSIAHGSTTLATKRRGSRPGIEQALGSPPPRGIPAATPRQPIPTVITDGTSVLTISHLTRVEDLVVSTAGCCAPDHRGGVVATIGPHPRGSS